MNRRTFLSAGGAALGTISIGYLLTGCGLDDSRSPTTLALIWDSDTIAEVGKKYRAAFPVEDSRQKLTELLSPLRGSDIEITVKEDFISARTVQIDGWIISLTEARQCALVSLTS